MKKIKIAALVLPIFKTNRTLMNIRIYECTNIRMYECTNVRIYECTNVRMYECTNIRIYEKLFGLVWLKI